MPRANFLLYWARPSYLSKKVGQVAKIWHYLQPPKAKKKIVKLNYLFRINFLHFTILLPPLPTYILEGKKLVKFNFTNFFCLLGRLVPDYLGEFFLLQWRWAQTGRYIFMGKLTQEHMYLGPFLYLKVIVHIYIECGIFYIRSVQNSKIIWFFVLCVYLLICFGAENQNYFFS